MLKSQDYLHIFAMFDSSKPESYSVTSADVEYGKYCLIMTVSILPLSKVAYNTQITMLSSYHYNLGLFIT